MPAPDVISALELRIPPPAVALVIGILMWWVPPMAHFSGFAVPGRMQIAGALALTGLVVGALGIISFRRAGTTVNPIRPADTSFLVVVGVYGISRNPMYLGLLLVLTGWAVHLSSMTALVFLPVFVLYMYRFQIVPEERMLALKFGPQYAAYKARVRRWL